MQQDIRFTGSDAVSQYFSTLLAKVLPFQYDHTIVISGGRQLNSISARTINPGTLTRLSPMRRNPQ